MATHRLRSLCVLAAVLGASVAFPSVASAVSMSWSAPIALDTGNTLYAVACPSTTQCTAVGGEDDVTFNPTAPGAPTPTPIDPGNALLAVACPSTTQCTAVDNHRYEVTFNPTAPGTPTRTLINNSGHALIGVACPSISQCTAVDQSGEQEVTFNPTTGGGRSSTTLLVSSYPTSVAGVACPSASQCTVVGDVSVNGGGGGGEEWTFNPAEPGNPRPTIIEPGNTTMTAVACPSTIQCTAVDQSGKQVTFNPTAPGTPAPTTIDTGQWLEGVACPSTSKCIAVDQIGRAVEGDPTTPASWTLEPIAGANVPRAIACSSLTQCVTVDQAGNAFVGTAPPPVITGFKLTHTRFTIGSRPTAISAGASATAKIPRGSAFRYTLSAPSTARIVIARKSTGRRVGTRCVTRTKANADKRHCTMYVRIGALSRRSKAGANTVAFSGRIGRRPLTAATYRATITARIGSGPRSNSRSATFTILHG